MKIEILGMSAAHFAQSLNNDKYRFFKFKLLVDDINLMCIINTILSVNDSKFHGLAYDKLHHSMDCKGIKSHER